MRYLLIAVVVLALCVPCFAQPHHFHFAGPMSQFLAEGCAPGAVTGGLPWAVVLTDAGATITPNPATFTLTAPGWEGTATLTLADAKFAGGHLTATIKLSNMTSAPLEGLRLDLTGATEEYKAKDDKGNDILKTRAQAVTIASPILLGDVAKKDDADQQPLDASTIAFQPETTRITVSGVISGLYYAGAIATPADSGTACDVDFDAQGRLYFLLTQDLHIYRCDADGHNITVAATLPEDLVNSPGNLTVDPMTGGMFASSHTVYRFGAGGNYQGLMPPAGAPDKDATQGFVGTLRFDPQGRMYLADEGTLACYSDNQRIWTADHVGEHEFHSPILFDVDGSGNFWVAGFDAHELYELGRRGVNGKVIATGPDWHLGRIISPWAVRADARGNVYVIEGESTEDQKQEAMRVSVFDSAGQIVRVFGHGDRVPAEQDGVLVGQVIGLARDLAFGLDGRVYIANNYAGAPILIFRPF